MQEAVYVQIAPDSASDDDNIEDKKTTKQLKIACIFTICATLFVASLGLYFLIKKD